MPIFLVMYFIFYGAMHAYVFFKARAAFNFGNMASLAIIAIMLLMICAPIFVRILEHWGFESPARIVAYVAYTWMGAVSIFTAAAIIVGIFRLLAASLGLFMNADTSAVIPSALNAFLIPLVAAIVVSAYGFYEAMDVRTVTYTLKSDRITAISGTIRLVQISDVHLGLMTGAYRTKRIIRVIEQARPDILVSTGDLIDGQTDNIEQTARLFGGITPRFGKFAVAGNHELYAGPELSRALTESGGFRMLNDESIKAGPVRLVGVMDRGHSLQGRIQSEIVKGLLMQSADDYTVLLKHNPSLLNGTEGMFDLQLSGHLHGGQVFPFIPLVRVFYPFISGLHRITDRSMLYISPGTGFWGPPMRVFARPEVTVFEIIPSS